MWGPDAVAAVLFVALCVYVLTGGADFGGGVLDLLASGPRRSAQRRVIARAIGPIWEANHVWLILVIVLLFTCFPKGFALIGTALHWPLTLLLIGVVLRGTAFVFRTYDSRREDIQARWSWVFSLASVFTPVMLGVSTGAVASGALTVDAAGVYTGGWVEPWLAPFPLATGAFTLALFTLLAAVYLLVDTEDAELREDFRTRALQAAGAVFVTAWMAYFAALRGAPLLAAGLLGSPLALVMQGLTALLGVALVGAIARRRYRIARGLAVVQVVALLAGWGANQWPWLVVGTLTVEQAAAPEGVLWGTLAVLGTGAPALIAAYVWMIRVFRRQKLSGAPGVPH
ncbi:MAG: cytochrome d ubiquinol oxidase subunit II [Alphaproteobacteria bacterium]|nr:cytochrome d ubiquinol oxidase subunit II [Alphaproteobacteria bacterium]